MLAVSFDWPPHAAFDNSLNGNFMTLLDLKSRHPCFARQGERTATPRLQRQKDLPIGTLHFPRQNPDTTHETATPDNSPHHTPASTQPVNGRAARNDALRTTSRSPDHEKKHKASFYLGDVPYALRNETPLVQTQRNTTNAVLKDLLGTRRTCNSGRFPERHTTRNAIQRLETT